MKKLFYAAAALAIFAGCSKDVNEASTTVSSKNGNTIELKLTVADDSRAVFDGDSHITWEKGDQLSLLIGESETSTIAMSTCGAFTFDGDDEKPTFSGKITDLATEPTAESYTVFGIYPYSADKSTYYTYLSKRTVYLPESQSPSQTSWDAKADVMVVAPTAVTGTTDSYREYDRDARGYVTYYKFISDNAEIRLSHIFGFGCISFGTLSDEFADEVVKKFSIKAVGDKTDIAGRYYVDLTKDTADADYKVESTGDSNVYDTITIKCDGTVSLKDFRAWFGAATGEYDVEISVTTPNYNLTFVREGLKIERAKIAYPVVNYNAYKDTVASTAVDLTGGKTWTHDASKNGYSGSFITSYKNPVEWGTDDDMPKVEYGITYSEDSSNYPSSTSLTITDGSYVYMQQLNANTLKDKGNVKLSSGVPYNGVQYVKITAGLYTYGSAGDFDLSVYVNTKSGAQQIGAAQKVVGNTTSSYTAIYDYYFLADSAVDGSLDVICDNFTNEGSGRAVLRLLVINPAPDIKTDVDSVSMYGAGGSGSADVNVYCGTIESVTSDADWLKVSYEDGKISYTADAYDGEEMSRNATITVTAKGLSTSTKEISVSQLSSKYTEYKLTIKPDDLNTALEAAAAAYLAESTDEEPKIYASTKLDVSVSFKAVATDGSGAEKDVDVYFSKVLYETLTDTDNSGVRYIAMANGWTDSSNGDIYNTTSLDKITSVEVTNSNYSSTYNIVYAGDSEQPTNKLTSTLTNSSNPYIWSATTGDSDEYGYFKIHQSYGNKLYEIDVTFISK